MRNLEDFLTFELVTELSKREGVETIAINPYQQYCVTSENQNILNTGPAIIFVITD